MIKRHGDSVRCFEVLRMALIADTVLARSHAMKGKNAGRKLNRRPRKKLDQEKEKTNLTDDWRTDGDSDRTPTDEGSIYFPLIDTFRFVTFPVEALPESQFVINHCR